MAKQIISALVTACQYLMVFNKQLLVRKQEEVEVSWRLQNSELRSFILKHTSKTNTTNKWCPMEQAEMSETSTQAMMWHNRRVDA
jgi:hypothetical protein